MVSGVEPSSWESAAPPPAPGGAVDGAGRGCYSVKYLS
jgi:hypothetical protein